MTGNWTHPIVEEDREACKTFTTFIIPTDYTGYWCNQCKSTFVVWPPYKATICPVCLNPMFEEDEMARISKESTDEKESGDKSQPDKIKGADHFQESQT